MLSDDICDNFPSMTKPSATTPPGSGSLDAIGELLEAVSGLALREGIKLQTLIDLTKQSMVRAAVELLSEGRPAAEVEVSDSKLSVMTGVHRKDLRMLRSPQPGPGVRQKNLAAEVYARWMSDPVYLTKRGQPRVLPRQAQRQDSPSFEQLVSGITSDVHPRAVLDELLRLSIVELQGTTDTVRIVANAFLPAADRAALLRFLAANAADHLRAGQANLDAGGTAFLEQAVFSDRLSQASAEQFNRLTRRVWEDSFATLMPALRALFDADKAAGLVMDRRVRFGMYGYVGHADTTSAAPAIPLPDENHE